MKIDFSSVIQKKEKEELDVASDSVYVINVPSAFIQGTKEMLQEKPVYILDEIEPQYDRLTIKDHLEFYRDWYGSSRKITDLMLQYNLPKTVKKQYRFLSMEMKQRLMYMKTLFIEESVIVFVNPIQNASIENIHLFHKTKEHLIDQGKSVLVLVNYMEDAYLVHPNIIMLTENGLKVIETEENNEDNSESNLKKIKVKSGDKVIFLDIEDVEYLESQNGKVCITTEGEKFVFETTLKEAEEKLSAYDFYRCHRSYIVNLHKVKEIISWSKNSYSVVLQNSNETKLPLSRTKFSDVQEKLQVI